MGRARRSSPSSDSGTSGESALAAAVPKRTPKRRRRARPGKLMSNYFVFVVCVANDADHV